MPNLHKKKAKKLKNKKYEDRNHKYMQKNNLSSSSAHFVEIFQNPCPDTKYNPEERLNKIMTHFENCKIWNYMRGMYKVITFPLLFQTLTLFSTGLNVGSTEAVSTKDKYNSITQSITQHEEI